jgi:hypothetical protein
MRGDDHQQSAMYSYLSPEQRVPADHPLRPIRQMSDEVMRQLGRRFSQNVCGQRRTVDCSGEAVAGLAAASAVRCGASGC